MLAAALGIVAGIVCSASAEEIDIYAGLITGRTSAGFKASDAVVRMRGGTLRASDLSYDQGSGMLHARGEVSVDDGAGTVLRAGAMDYDVSARSAVAEQGAVLAGAGKFVLEAERLKYDFAKHSGNAVKVIVAGEDDSGQISAARAQISDDGYALEDAAFTTCKVDDPDWELRARRIKMGGDRVMRAAAASLVMGGFTVMHIPSMTFSLSRERRSGFLSPSFKYREGGEYDLRVPYYLNLAPNYDAVIGARLISKRGAMIFARPRWLLPEQGGSAAAGYVSDSLAGTGRHYWELEHKFRRGAASLELAGMRVSDDLVAVDFLDSEASAVRHFPAQINLGWDGGSWRAGMLVLRHQTVFASDKAVDKPYDVQPALSYVWSGKPARDWFVAAEGEWARFTSRAGGPGMPGRRFRLDLSARREFELERIRAALVGGVAGAAYSRDGRSWRAPYLAADMRYPFGLSGELLGKSVRQSIEPRLFAAVVRSASFAQIPVYDTARIPLNYEQMFSVNPFVGGDRFEDASFVSYGLDTTIWDLGAKRELLAARIGQQFRFSDSTVRALDEAVPAAGPSVALAEMQVWLTEELSANGLVEWDPQGGWEQVQTEVRHIGEEAAYGIRYARTDISGDRDDKGSAGASLWRMLNDRTQVAVDVRYNLNEARLNSVSSGLRRVAECGCWQMDMLVDHEKISEGRDKTSFSLQLVLEGLGGIGSRNLDGLISSIRRKL